MDPELKAMFATLAESQALTDATLKMLAEDTSRRQAITDSNIRAVSEQLSQSVKRHDRWNEEAARHAAEMDKRLTAAHERTEAALADLATSVKSYSEGWQERMQRIEANLDLLIRAITREHSNGKAH
jgi:predicted secreted Zn-dependent protease